mgnify:CR=1 FL=1
MPEIQKKMSLFSTYAPFFVSACRRLVNHVLGENFRLEDAWALAKEVLAQFPSVPAEELAIVMELKKALSSYTDRDLNARNVESTSRSKS